MGPAPPDAVASCEVKLQDLADAPSKTNGELAASVAAGEAARARGDGARLAAEPAPASAAAAAAAASLTAEDARALAAAGWPWLDVDHPVTLGELVKAIPMLPMLGLRAFLVAVCMPFVTAVAMLAVWRTEPDGPLPAWRARLVRPFLAWWARFLLRWGWACVPAVAGAEHLADAEQARAVIVFNHVSYLDPLALAGLCAPAAIAKAGVSDAPGFGAFARALQCVFVSRGGGCGDGAAGDASSRPSSADSQPATPPLAGGRGAAATIAARAADGRYPLVAVAPEGTTKAGPCLLRFRSGAFVPGRPVLPVLFSYGGEGKAPLPRPAFHPGWGRVSSALAHFARSQASPANRLAVRVLPLYRPSPAEVADPGAYAENVRHHMAAALGVPPVEAGLKEWAALKAAGICTDALGRRVLWRQGGRADAPLVELEGGAEAVRAAAAAAGVVAVPASSAAPWPWRRKAE